MQEVKERDSLLASTVDALYLYGAYGGGLHGHPEVEGRLHHALAVGFDEPYFESDIGREQEALNLPFLPCCVLLPKLEECLPGDVGELGETDWLRPHVYRSLLEPCDQIQNLPGHQRGNVFTHFELLN